MDHEQDENRLTKQMAAFLRHKGLRSMQSDGYALVDDLANSCHCEVTHILEVTQMPGKQRFQTTHDGQNLWIRATHGHTLKTVDVQGSVYTEIKVPLPVLVHAVSGESVAMVLAKGLHRGGRPHLLFAISDEEEKLKQGFQDSCNILVYVNMAKAMFAGIPFHWAPDGIMVVSAGFPERKNRRKNEKVGTIPADFILRVSNRGEKSGQGTLQMPQENRVHDGHAPNPSQDLLRLVTGRDPAGPSGVPHLRPVLPGEPAEASAEAYEKLAQMQRTKELMQMQQQQAHLRQMLQLNQLKEQHDQIIQVQQHMLQQQQQMAQRNAQKTLLDTAHEVEHLSRQLEATQAALTGGFPGQMYAAQGAPEAPFPPHLQHLFGGRFLFNGLAAAAQSQGAAVPRKLQ